MPYRWTPDHTRLDAPKPHTGDAPLVKLDIWPHRSMPNSGFKAAIWLMFLAGCLPVLAFIGTAAFWVLLAGLLITLAALWTALRLSDREYLREELLIWHDKVILTHWTTKNLRKEWQANPYWIKLHLRAEGGPVEQYLTLYSSATDNGRAVELAAFLSPEERQTLHKDLAFVLGQLKPR
ncbi:DUF2244 domain-containing protein [Pacificibacter sp. AS14]|uniref:DUF2244 domain-containing protein n=1 Tax=Pacificibacter sp. AS14 TaxID=3135785 RepID=UPI00317A9813